MPKQNCSDFAYSSSVDSFIGFLNRFRLSDAVPAGKSCECVQCAIKAVHRTADFESHIAATEKTTRLKQRKILLASGHYLTVEYHETPIAKRNLEESLANDWHEAVLMNSGVIDSEETNKKAAPSIASSIAKAAAMIDNKRHEAKKTAIESLLEVFTWGRVVAYASVAAVFAFVSLNFHPEIIGGLKSRIISDMAKPSAPKQVAGKKIKNIDQAALRNYIIQNNERLKMDPGETVQSFNITEEDINSAPGNGYVPTQGLEPLAIEAEEALQ